MAVTVKITTFINSRMFATTDYDENGALSLVALSPLFQDGGSLMAVDRAPLKPADASVPVIAPLQQ